MDREYFPGLDALRGVAALAVVAFHVPAWSGLPSLAPSGYLAVDLFFLLSGFVLAEAYGRSLLAGDVASFMLKRLIRLYPAYILGLGCGALFFALRGSGDGLSPGQVGAAAVSGLLFLPVPFRIDGIREIFPLDTPAWSLFFELAANFGWALVLPFVTRRRLAIVIALSALALSAGIARYGSAHIGWATWHFVWGIPRVAFSFAAGLLLHALPRLRLAPARHTLLAAIVTIAAVAMLFLDPRKHVVYDLAAIGLVFPLAVLVLAGVRVTPRGQRIAGALGDLSYPIYVLHVPVYWLVGLVATGPLAWVSVALGLLPLSLLVAKTYERHARRWLAAHVLHRDGRRARIAAGR